MLFSEHCVQWLTDADGGPDRVVYFFDDVFVAQRPDLTAYLLHEGPLPDGAGEPGWRPTDARIGETPSPLSASDEREGRLYVVPEFRDEQWMLEELSQGAVEVVHGLRLPDLCRRLMRMSPEEADESRGFEYLDLQTRLSDADLADDPLERAFIQSLQSDPDDEASWRAYADWLTERDGPSPGCRLLCLALPRVFVGNEGVRTKNVVHVGEHLARVSIHVEDGEFANLILFDDLWGAAHPVLADALLRYATRWDVLSTGEEE